MQLKLRGEFSDGVLTFDGCKSDFRFEVRAVLLRDCAIGFSF
jgi:hypothetical protein